MEFRFLKGNWPFGKFKLQTRASKRGQWKDVPTVVAEEEKQPEAKQPKEQK